MISHLIVGSGLSAWATALALIDRGLKPILVDFGSETSQRDAQISHLGKLATKGVQRSVAAFSYPSDLVSCIDGRHLPLSSIRGGLGELWGAGILHRKFDELTLDPSVRGAVEVAQIRLANEFFPSGTNDQSSRRFTLSEKSTSTPMSGRYSKIFASLQQVESPQVIFGTPRIAFGRPVSTCVKCGLCRSGCPEELFFSPRTSIERLARDGMLELVEGPVLDVSPQNSFVDVRLPGQVIQAEKVFISAGPIATPALLQRSRLLRDEVTVSDSAVFYGMFLNRERANGDEFEFASAHMVAFSTSSGVDDFQLAFYESHHELTERIATHLRLPRNLFRLPKRVQLRLNPVIGFLGSARSGRLRLTYRANQTVVSRETNTETAESARAVIQKVSAATKQFGLWSSPRLLSVPGVGDGYHSGASLPVGGEDVDLDGRLRSHPNVLITDASSLVDIPAGSHTFLAMANAYRIAMCS